MRELENLLNKLIEEWRKPFWITLKTKIKIHEWVWFYDDKTIELELDCGNMGKYIRLRQIVSLESWIRQFLCDKGLLKSIWKARAKEPSISALGFKSENLALSFEPEYRLLESSLVPEEELAKFLVDNIKVECKKE